MPTFTGFNTDMFRAEVIAGGAAETDLEVDGITPDDILLMVLHQDVAGLLLADLTAETSISGDGTIQTATTDTSTDTLVVVWLDVSQAEV